MSLVKQCKFLEPKLGAEFTSEVLSQPDLSLKDLKERVVKVDRMRTLEMSENHLSLQFALKIAKENSPWWMKLWDVALKHSLEGTRSFLSSNCSAWLSLQTDSALLVTACTMSSFLKHPHCVNISCNVTQTCLLRLPLTTAQTVSSPPSLNVNGF